MAELSAAVISDVVQVCRAEVAEVAAVLGRALDAEVRLEVGEPGTIVMDALPEGIAGPGMVVVFWIGGAGAILTLPESSGLLPLWYGRPDLTGKAKLATLGQELSMLLFPEPYAPDEAAASRVACLSDALVRGGVADGAAALPLAIERADGVRATAQLIWPAANPGAVQDGGSVPKGGDETPAPQAPGADSTTSPPKRAPQPNPAVASSSTAPSRTLSTDVLPGYSRSLLRISLPVVVTLARKQQPLRQITELGPGSIIQFDKSCEELLDLDVGRRTIATGEAVKVGDKFGLRINSMILPGERFKPVRTEKVRS
jgi:flagellar motor switch/type III secretory pathway protein FliN